MVSGVGIFLGVFGWVLSVVSGVGDVGEISSFGDCCGVLFGW